MSSLQLKVRCNTRRPATDRQTSQNVGPTQVQDQGQEHDHNFGLETKSPRPSMILTPHRCF